MPLFKHTLILNLISILIGASCFAQSQERLKSNLATNEISGEAQLVTHFVERGLSMSDKGPAMNASFLYNLGSQLRLGFWGSNVSNLSATDDNFWFKFLAEFNVDFKNNLSAQLYVSDNHFYKSDQHNGQRIGGLFSYYTYYFTLEWMSNLEGSKSSAEYLNVGKLFNYGNKIKYGGDIGVTNSHNANINIFFDARLLARYFLNTTTSFEAAATYNSYTSYFGSRADPAYYLGVKLIY